MRYQSYFNTAARIIQQYNGTTPLQHFLKQYFSEHKKHGSKDRKIITHLCYSFYRLGKAFADVNPEEKLKLAIFVCNDVIEDWKFLYEEEWVNNHTANLGNRIAFIKTKYVSFSLQDIFPFISELSEGINTGEFIRSFLMQPDVFIRTRPGHYATVTNKLQQHTIAFTVVEENCISLSPFTKIDTIINIDEEAVVQDYSSQQIKSFLKIVESAISYEGNLKPETSVWDCCAGSGGKSMLAYDILKNIELMVSDIRPSIIQNLKQRFAKAGIKQYKTLVNDLTNSKTQIPNSTYDLIICDAPCTGSGTWSRTPEQLYFFNKEKINEYALRQKKIVSAAIRSLKNNGYFLYITCSVFKEENEKIAAFIRQLFNLELLKMEMITGYDKKADTMFAALFKKT